ncbi:GIY-YIG nuclease family protein [Candidatus Dojkabacteria bacterium]|uniref:GIY-YIG nuclease family protein n=1 Tax=Candidatus Dojkabacteria bacterium TaxID=2099670 RepID=A0A955L7V4_9BACT|nr:GIY-YIG nuclease family protein [Candidatus Dojkabacteria bacterium]
MEYYVYILASKRNGTLYIGVTNDLSRRVYEHRRSKGKSFSSKYLINKLVYYEEFDSISDALQREKVLKKWYRKWKIELIESVNSEWKDLYQDLY